MASYHWGGGGGLEGLVAEARRRREARDRVFDRYATLLRRADAQLRQRQPTQHRQAQHEHGRTPVHASQWQEKSQISGYEVEKRLEKGGLSESVKVARHRATGTVRVLKRVNSKARPKQELEILKRIPKYCHLNYMVEYTWISRIEVQLVLEYCDLGDLHHMLGNQIDRRKFLPEGFVWNVLEDVGKALAFLHSGINDPTREVHSQQGWDTIVHLDIKPANIFIARAARAGDCPRIVLGDFGCAITWSDVKSRHESSQVHRYGTRAWFPPHSDSAVVGERSLAYGWHTDVWQLGAVAASMCRLTLVPDRRNLFREHSSPCGPRYSRQLDAVVKGCVRFDRSRRPRAAELVRAPELVRAVVRRR